MGLLMNPVQGLIDRVTGGNTTSDAPDIERPAWHPIYKGLMDRGLSSTVAASAAANIGAESGFDPAAFNEAGGGQGALGLAQWRGPRQAALKAMAAEAGVDPSDLDTQLDFLVSELEGTEAGTMTALEGVTDISEGARIFRDKFERPGGHGYENTDAFAGEMSTYLGNVARGEERQNTLNKLSMFSDDAAARADEISQTLLSGSNPDGLPSPDYYNPGTAVPGPSAEVTRSLPSGSPVVPAGQGAGTDAGPEGGGLMDKISSALFPNADDPSEKFSNMIGGLGVGLGQMSAGETVNLQPYFQNIAAQKQSIITSQQKAAKDKVTAQTDAFKMQTARLNAEVAVGNLELNRENAISEREALEVPTFSQEQLAGYAANPATAPFVDMLNSGDRSTYDEGVRGIREAIIADVKTDPDTPSTLGELHEAVARNAPPKEIADIITRGDLDGADMNAVYQNLGMRPSAFVNEIEAYKNADAPTQKLMEKRWAAQMGREETPKQKEERQWAYKQMDGFDKLSGQSNAILSNLLDMERTTYDMLDEGVETGPLNAIYASTVRGITQVFGDEVGNAAMNLVGGDVALFEKMDQAEQALALMIAQPLMEGGGAISDGERKSMLRMLSRGDSTHAGRLEIIQKLKVEHNMNKLIAKEYGDRLGDDFGAARGLKKELREASQAVMLELSRTSQAVVGIYNMNRELKGFEQYKGMSQKQIVKSMSPKMTQEQYDMFGSILPDIGENHVRPWILMDPNDPYGPGTIMNGDVVMQDKYMQDRKTK